MQGGSARFWYGLILGTAIGVAVGRSVPGPASYGPQPRPLVGPIPWGTLPGWESTQPTAIPNSGSAAWSNGFPPGAGDHQAPSDPLAEEIVTFDNFDETISFVTPRHSPDTRSFGEEPATLTVSNAAPLAGRQSDGSLSGKPGLVALEPSDVEEASPLEPAESDDEATVRALIESELSDLPPTQRDVWFDALRDLPKEDALGVLKMWKRFGGPVGATPSPLLTTPSDTPPDLLPPPDLPRDAIAPGSGLTSIATARAIHLDNIAMKTLPGYKKMMPRLVSRGMGDPASFTGLGVAHDLEQGPKRVTENPFDIAIDGSGFLRVTDGENVLFTRYGSLTLDAERRLALTGFGLRLEPAIEIPAKATQLHIDRKGIVTVDIPDEEERFRAGQIELSLFLNPGELRREMGVLFAESPLSGPAQSVKPGTQPAGAILQEHLELSNVDVEDEILELDDLDTLQMWLIESSPFAGE